MTSNEHAVVLIAQKAWLEMGHFPWIRLAQLQDLKTYLKKITPHLPKGVSAIEFYDQLRSGRHKYVLVVLLQNAPACILKRATDKLRIRHLC